MEQNNFEKNMQQKMDELKIAPSESVWTNVEKRIGKKDKDRKLIFMLFLLIVFLLSGGYWLMNSSKNNQNNNHQIGNVIKNESSSKGRNNEDSSFAKPGIILQNKPENNDVARVLVKKIKDSNIHSQNIIDKEKEKNGEKIIGKFESEPKENFSKQRNNEDSAFALNEKKPAKIKSDIFEKENENVPDNSMNNIENHISAESISKQLKLEKTGEKIIAKNDSAKKNNSAKKHWDIGFTFSGGASLIGNDLLERNSRVADLSAAFPGGSSSGNPGYFYSPSPIKNSTAFIAGIFIEKNISVRGKIALGLSYKYYSLVNKVGKKVDSLLSPSTQYFSVSNSYNSYNSIHTHRNNFHFLEVPVSFKLQINKNKKLHLSWETGVDLSQLISSNALQFKPNPGLYYNDNLMFHKTQFGLNTGLFVTLFSHQKMTFTVGPYFYYSFSKLAEEGLYQNKHFSFIGIRTEILLKKK
jgi:hypothetical protein